MELHKTNFSGLYYTILKSGNYSFYYTFRDPISGKPVRKKIFTKPTLSEHNIKQAYNKGLKLKEVESKFEEIDNQEKILDYKKKAYENKKKEEEYNLEFIKSVSAPELIVAGHKYYQDMYANRKSKLRAIYNTLTNEEFEKDKRVLRKLRAIIKEEKKFYNYFQGFPIADQKINKITHSCIKMYETTITERAYSTKTIKNIYDKARASIHFWNREYGTKYNNPFSTYKYKVVEKRLKRVLDPKGLKMLLDTCKNYQNNKDLCFRPSDYNPCVYISVYLAVITAARKSTILQLQKKDFDFKKGVLYLKNIKVDNQEFVIHLNKESVEYFKNILQDYQQEEYIIRPTEPQRKKDFYKSNQPLNDVPKKVYEIMDYLFNQDYLHNRRANKDNIVSFHTIRRSVATNLADKGVPLVKIKNLLNHATTQQTEEYIQRTEQDIKIELNDLMTDIFT